MVNKLTKEEFIKRLNNIQPELILVGEFTTLGSNVVVRDKYGECAVVAKGLLRGRKPSVISAVNKDVYTKNKFIEVHGNTYGYNKVKYTGTSNKVKS